jgi:hypothetical protein
MEGLWCVSRGEREGEGERREGQREGWSKGQWEEVRGALWCGTAASRWVGGEIRLCEVTKKWRCTEIRRSH